MIHRNSAPVVAVWARLPRYRDRKGDFNKADYMDSLTPECRGLMEGPAMGLIDSARGHASGWARYPLARLH
jgi:hypothetical protein